MENGSTRTRWKAILRRRCPRCLEGSVYRSTFRPNSQCPNCALVFEREPGYFLGSFYVSYGLGAGVAIPAALAAIYFEVPMSWLFLIVALWVGVMGPLIVSYARVLWYHLDHSVDPR